MNFQHRVTVIGGGSFGTVLANIVAHNGFPVTLWLRDQDLAEEMRQTRVNSRYVPGLYLHDDLEIVTDFKRCVNHADTVIFSVPSKAFRGVLEQVKDFINDQQFLVTTAKGIEPDHFLLMSQLLEVYFPKNPIGVVSGPNLAKEVAAKQLTGTVIASDNEGLRQQVQALLQCDFFRVYASNDPYGTELGGALKNIYAIAAGMAHGLGYGDNFQSVLMSNATREMKRFIKKAHKMKRNINETVYLGDLLVTCYSLFSRNRMFGNMIGKGYTVKSAQMEMSMIAEGYYATKSAYEINQSKESPAQTPIIDTVYEVLYLNKNSKKAFKKLTDKLS